MPYSVLSCWLSVWHIWIHKRDCSDGSVYIYIYGKRDGERMYALAAGMDAHIPKPIILGQFKSTVQDVLECKGQLKNVI